MNSYPTQEEINRARARLKLAPARLDQQQQAGFTRQPERATPPPLPPDRSTGGVSGFLQRITTPLVDIPDQTNPILHALEVGVEGLTSPVGIVTTALAPVTGGTSLGLSGALGLGARLATRLGAEAVAGAAAGVAAEKTAAALEDAPGIIKVPATLLAGAAAGGLATGGIRGLSKLSSGADDAAKVVANTVAQAQDAFTPEANQFIDAIGKAKSLLKDKAVAANLKEQRSAVLGTRIAAGRAAEAAAGGSTNARISAFMTELKGDLPRLEFPEIKVTPEVISKMRDQIWESLNLSDLDRINAIKGFETAVNLHGVPSRSELLLLEKVFGPAFSTALDSLRPYGLKSALSDIINLPRSLMASSDLSFPLNQGIFGAAADPKSWAESVKTAAKSFADPAFAKEHDLWARGVTGTDFHKAATGLMQKAGLEITGSAARPEEVFQASDRIMKTLFANNTAGGVLAASERGYVGAGNSLRVNLGEKTLAKLASIYMKPGDDEVKALSRVPYAEVKRLTETVNVLTGRSSWKVFQQQEGWSKALNAFFFAPNFLASRLEAPTLLPRSIYSKVASEGIGVLANPVALYKSDPVMALQARALGGFVAAGVGAIGAMKIAKESGLLPEDVDVEVDPRSSNFGKVKVGPTTIDFWGGYSQIARAVIRTATGEAKSQSGNIYSTDATKELWDNFVRSKTAPIPGLAWDVITGTTFNGERAQTVTEIDRLVADNLMPLAIQDIMQGYMDGGFRSAAIQSSALLGARTSTFQSLAALKDSVAQEKFGKPYRDLAGRNRTEVDNHSSVLEKQRERDQVSGENFSTALQDIQYQRSQNENIIAARYLTTGNIKEFTDSIEDQQLIAATRRDAAAKQFNITEAQPNSPLQQALQGWYDLYDQSDFGYERGVKTGQVDFNALEALQSSYLKGLTPEQRAFIEDQTSAPHDPSVQWYFNNKKYITDSGYYDVADAAFAKVAARVRDLGIESYGELIAASGAAKRTGDRQAEARLAPHVRTVSNFIEDAHQKMRRQDPKLDASLISIGRATKPVTVAARKLLQGE